MPTFTHLKPPTTEPPSPRRTAAWLFRTIPIIPFIEGDGTGPDIWRASVRVFDAAVAEGLRRQAEDRVEGSARRREGVQQVRQLAARRNARRVPRITCVGIKGPLTTPVGGGIRSLNVALRQMLDLYVCLRPVRYFKGVPSPVKQPGEGGHGDLPREHGRHLRRHRIRRRHARSAEGARLPREGVSEGVQEDPLRHQGASRRLAEAARSRSARRSASCRSRSASASSRSAISAPSGWCTARSATRSRTSARA